MADTERRLAVFLDFENLALGFQRGSNKSNKTFSIQPVLERLVEKGKILVKVGYADWSRFGEHKAALHESAFALVDIPKRNKTGKNSADIRLCVDAMDLSYAKDHIDTFVIISGDSDFSPLVSKLKENGKYVIGLGMEGSSSNLLVDNCDEFIFYEELEQVATKPPPLTKRIPQNKRAAFQLMIESVIALMRENKEVIYSSMVKDTMQRKQPSFNEGRYGYRTFSELLEDAEKFNLIVLRRDARSGTYAVQGFGKSSK